MMETQSHVSQKPLSHAIHEKETIYVQAFGFNYLYVTATCTTQVLAKCQSHDE